MTVASGASRPIPVDWMDDAPAPCGFCGEEIRHVNGGGTGFLVVDAAYTFYLVHWTIECPTAPPDWWWEHCDLLQIGAACARCQVPRPAGTPD